MIILSKTSRIWVRISTFRGCFKELPLIGLLRLSLFQVSVGIATVLLVGTLNRAMIVELKAEVISGDNGSFLLLAPFRAWLQIRQPQIT